MESEGSRAVLFTSPGAASVGRRITGRDRDRVRGRERIRGGHSKLRILVYFCLENQGSSPAVVIATIDNFTNLIACTS